MRKKNKTLLMAAFLLMLPSVPFVVAASVSFNDQPLAGVGTSYGPNVALAISVEYPTAKTAYPGGVGTINSVNVKDAYLGYFDSNKCYKYVNYNDNGNQIDFPNISEADGYFYPSSIAKSEGGYIGLCNNGGEVNEFSGNVLNFMATSAIDVFRSAMTGGNRAYGTSTDSSAYEKGDGVTATFLRKSRVTNGSNWGGDNTWTHYIESTGKDANGISGVGTDLFRRLMPKRLWEYQKSTASKAYTTKALAFVNSNSAPFSVVVNQYYENKEAKNIKTFNIVVKVCDLSLGEVGLEDNCVRYGNNYKPEGLLQSYGRDSGMRVAVLGYNLYPTRQTHGGVLRARMKDLLAEKVVKAGNSSYTLRPEWNTETGVLERNPDKEDAAATTSLISGATTISNSGVINYVNKFGDANGYKRYDHVAELYYTALRYLRNGAWQGAGQNQTRLSDAYSAAPYPFYRDGTPKNVVDGFPAIYNWEDPLDAEGDARNAMCRKNTIIAMGDTGNHEDWNLPNFSGATWGGAITVKDNIQTAEYMKKLLSYEGISQSKWSDNFGAYRSPGGVGALAFWANTQDIRPDVTGNQNVNTFMIDVVEAGYHGAKTTGGISNVFYWAAKYGGFDTSLSDGSNLNTSAGRSAWTTDPEGSSTIPFTSSDYSGNGFGTGTPKNYAPANTPDKMKTALQNAFLSAAGSSTSQTSATFASDQQSIDLSSGKTVVLQTTYNPNNWTGNVIASTATSTSAGKTVLTEQWRAASLMNGSYHSSDSGKWSARNVYGMNGNSVLKLSENLSSFSSLMTPTSMTDAEKTVFGSYDLKNVLSYMLGDQTNEDGTSYRIRNSSILGTVVNSKVAAILPKSTLPTVNGSVCRYSSSIVSRSPSYAFAANDGMLHVLNSSGSEILAYMPTTVFPKLYKYVLPTYSHFYLNDGSPVTAELCDGAETRNAKSYLVGSTGRGGRAVYALDVTNLDNPGSANVLWEFNKDADSDLGNTTGNVVLSKDFNGNPIAVFSSGYWSNTDGIDAANKRGYLYIVQLSKIGSWNRGGVGSVLGQGVNFIKIPLGNAGVGTPYVFDSNGDGTAGRIYVGDQEGKVWRIDQMASDSGSSKKGSWSVSYNGQPLFKPDSTAEAMPIIGAPYVQTIKGTTYVVVGSGLYFNKDNLASDVQNYAYGFFDTGVKTITSSDLLKQELTTVDSLVSTTNSTVTYYKITKNGLESNNRGWRLKLLPGQSISSAGGIRKKKVAEFTAVRFIDSTDSCVQNGATMVISVDVRNGGLYTGAPIFDTNGDGIFDSSDGYYGAYEQTGVQNPDSGVTTGQDGRTTSGISTGGSDLNQQALNPLLSDRYVRRFSWRQLFE